MIPKSSKQRKPPPRLPQWVVKAMWDSTASYMKVFAKNELDAWDRAWKQVARREGGSLCLQIKVIRRIS